MGVDGGLDRLEAGSWKLEAGSWKLEAGSWKLEAGSKSGWVQDHRCQASLGANR
ncbi:MAG: phosphotransferase [Pseudomonadales bacterium]|nr:phosphotransferase [Pseudomonadales bacterium]